MGTTVDRRRVQTIVLGGVGLLTLVAIGLLIALISGLEQTAEEPSGSVSASAFASASTSPAEPSGTPDASGSVSQAPTPTTSPSVPAPDINPALAIVLVDELRLREEPGTSGRITGTVKAGEALEVSGHAEVVDGIEWWHLFGGERYGWASAGPDDSPYLELRWRTAVRWSASIERVATGDGGMLAWGYEAGRSDQFRGRLILASSDGITWQRASLPAELTEGQIVAAGWGPAGWLLANAVECHIDVVCQTFHLWQSDDGLAWTTFPPLEPFPWPLDVDTPLTGIYGSADEYLIRVGGFGDSGQRLARSTDGRNWTEIEGWEADWRSGLVPLPFGYLSWTSGADTTAFTLSQDGGRTWTDLPGASDLPGSANDPPLVAVVNTPGGGTQLVVVTTDFRTGEQRFWRSEWASQSFAWERLTAAEAVVAGDAVTALVARGGTLVAIGYDADTAEPRAWRGSLTGAWSALGADANFSGTTPGILVAGTQRFLAVSGEATSAGLNPVLWQSDGGESWSALTVPELPVIESPRIGACPSLPTTMVDFMLVPGSLAAECFGSTPITFRTYLTESAGCGGFAPGTYLPDWLASPWAKGAFVLAPLETAAWDCGSAVRPPTLSSPPDLYQWVTVTGRYNDPAAETCHWVPDPEYRWGSVGPEWLVVQCRAKFVVTEIAPSP